MNGQSSPDIEVNPRIGKRHPELSDEDVLHAWRNAVLIIERTTASFPDVILVALGCDGGGRLLELVGVVTDDQRVHVFHAMTPPSKKTLREVEMSR